MKRVINLGHTQVVTDEATTTPAPPPNSPPNRAGTTPVSASDVERLTGSRVLMPKWLPSAEFQLAGMQKIASMRSPDSVMGTVLIYRSGPGRWIAITQRPNAPKSIGIPVSGVEGRVGDKVAVFFNRTVPAKALPSGQLDVLQCFWERDGSLMAVDAAGLSLEEVVRTAESLS